MKKSTRMLAALGSGVCMALGMSAVFMGSFPVLLEAVSASMGWGLSVFPRIVLVASVTGAICNPIAGRLIDRFDVRLPLLGGTLSLALGLYLLSTIEAPGPAFMLAGVLIGLGAALGGPLAHIKVVSSWFDRRRGIVMGLVLAMSPMLAQAGVAPLVRWLVQLVGWRESYRLLGLAVLLIAGAAVLLLIRTRPVEVRPHGHAGDRAKDGAGWAARQAFLTRTFWTLTVAECLVAGSLIGAQAHLVSWLRTRGIGIDESALLLSVQAVAGLVGSFVVGALLDRLRSRWATAAMYLLPAAALLLMGVAHSLPMLVLAAAFMGMTMSVVVLLLPYLVTRFFGQRASAEILGLAFACSMTAIGCGPWLIGLAFDATGSYSAPMMGAVAAGFLAAALMATLSPRTFQLADEAALGEALGIGQGPFVAPKILS
jgi:predicted MFS family arabinose efflux permease